MSRNLKDAQPNNALTTRSSSLVQVPELAAAWPAPSRESS